MPLGGSESTANPDGVLRWSVVKLGPYPWLDVNAIDGG
jgi:hypothetical protein